MQKLEPFVTQVTTQVNSHDVHATWAYATNNNNNLTPRLTITNDV